MKNLLRLVLPWLRLLNTPLLQDVLIPLIRCHSLYQANHLMHRFNEMTDSYSTGFFYTGSCR